ncbi:Uncharacterised protein [Burkholderia pseudomallei]|nr:Uncharacterised protein [Burkholderia pseudomallei]VCO48367.1 Uncharacterised protein [Burkholderia pseudomallei]
MFHFSFIGRALRCTRTAATHQNREYKQRNKSIQFNKALIHNLILLPGCEQRGSSLSGVKCSGHALSGVCNPSGNPGKPGIHCDAYTLILSFGKNSTHRNPSEKCSCFPTETTRLAIASGSFLYSVSSCHRNVTVKPGMPLTRHRRTADHLSATATYARRNSTAPRTVYVKCADRHIRIVQRIQLQTQTHRVVARLRHRRAFRARLRRHFAHRPRARRNTPQQRKPAHQPNNRFPRPAPRHCRRQARNP